MPKPKTTCPRCGNPNARPNAQGPDKIHCKRCGGLVPVADRDEIDEDLISTNPEHNAMERERGIAEAGRVMPERAAGIRGGLER